MISIEIKIEECENTNETTMFLQAHQWCDVEEIATPNMNYEQ